MDGWKTAGICPRALPGFSGCLLRILGRRLRHGQMAIDTAAGRESFHGREPGPEARLTLHRPWRLLAHLHREGALGLAESYLAGDWDSEDLTGALELLGRNEPYLGRSARPTAAARLWHTLQHRLRDNSHRGSRRNISAHYDLGNPFYRLWLDEGMSYSGALFEDGTASLEAAQEAKYQSILDRLALRPGDHVLEIGCGWGGFAVAAARRGARVTGVTLSREQLDFARERIGRLGLEQQVELRLQDYRDVTGSFDRVVSIEMFEAVGERYWPVYFAMLERVLRRGGCAAMQVITINEAWFEQYRATPDFIQRHVFPGGMLPTAERFTAVARDAGLRVTDTGFFGTHYARTLNAWQRRFLSALPDIEKLGYDRRFQRLWQYYLAYCEAGFRLGRIDLMQATLRKPLH